MGAMSDVRWVLPDHSTEALSALTRVQQALHLNPVVAKVLVQRGYRTPEAVRSFLDDSLANLPDPFQMKGLPEAVTRLARAITSRERVVLYGDYDVDGVSSTALLASFLRDVGLEVKTYIPHRLAEGYGLNRAAIEKLAAEGMQLLVTLDCGITSHAEIEVANSLGVNVIVVDHHAVPEVMPPAVAVLNPLQPGCAYPTKWLCAGGVTFNLCMGLRKHLREAGAFEKRPEPNLRQFLDLVALATVADVVPLVGANRILVTHGLKELSTARRPGVKALKTVAGLDGETITASHVGFRLGPRINAAGRLDDASVGLRLLLSTDVAAATPLAMQLDEANQERQQIERAMLESALEQAEAAVMRGARGLVLHADNWHPGVVGIVASRVVERFHRPTVLIGIRDGVGRGSARSIEGFHLYEAIKACGDVLERFGGHKAAAGVTVALDKLEAFRTRFEALCAEKLKPEDLVGRCKIDATVEVFDLKTETVKALQQLAPFGMGNAEPTLALERQMAEPRVLPNKTPGEPGHLKLTLGADPLLDVIGFRLAERARLIERPVDLAFTLGEDEFRGVRRLALKLKDIRAHG